MLEIGTEFNYDGYDWEIVGYVFWDAMHRYYVQDGNETHDWPEYHLKHYGLKKVQNEEQSAV